MTDVLLSPEFGVRISQIEIMSKQNNILLEIGVEELPLSHWKFVANGTWQKVCEDLFEENRIGFEEVKINTTPRRIVFQIFGVPTKQKSEEKVFRGPSVDKAFDVEGKPSKALEGFLKSKGITLKQTKEEKTDKGTYLVAKVSQDSKSTSAILPGLLQQLIQKLPFSKNMRWESSGIRFARPVRWLSAFYQNKLVKMSFAGVKAEAFSYGHRFLSPKKFAISKPENFSELLKKKSVILDRGERREMVYEQVSKLLKKKGWSTQHIDEELVDEITELVEEPAAISGDFDKNFLKLPSEVLATCMKKNQKIFACYDTKGKLIPHFIAVINGKRAKTQLLTDNYANVLESRLRDARFFYQDDTQTPLSEKVTKLEGIVFLGKLGTIAEKTGRLKQLAVFFSDCLALSDKDKQDLGRAAQLCKVDLVSSMVYEFPELQGIMGREYALFDKESPAVARAIDAHYWPKSLNISIADIKKSIDPIGGLLAIIEKVDTLVGAFGSGLIPTGSQDPYALRRASGGIVKLIHAFGFSFSLSQLIQESQKLYSDKISPLDEETLKRLLQFFKERIVYELEVKPGSNEHEILNAILQSGFDDISDVFRKFELLNQCAKKEKKKFAQAAKVVERTGRILKGVKEEIPSDVNESLFEEALERKLFEVMQTHEAQFKKELDNKEYAKATEFYGDAFYGPINEFFDSVMVNAEDQKVRGNRQALMRKINSLYVDSVADLSCISNL